MARSPPSRALWTLLSLAVAGIIDQAQAIPQCIADERINAEFEALIGGFEIPRQDSCCMWDVCGLACPQEVEDPSPGTSFLTLSRESVFNADRGACNSQFYLYPPFHPQDLDTLSL